MPMRTALQYILRVSYRLCLIMANTHFPAHCKGHYSTIQKVTHDFPESTVLLNIQCTALNRVVGIENIVRAYRGRRRVLKTFFDLISLEIL
jgi:hypothetical protein